MGPPQKTNSLIAMTVFIHCFIKSPPLEVPSSSPTPQLTVPLLWELTLGQTFDVFFLVQSCSHVRKLCNESQQLQYLRTRRKKTQRSLCLVLIPKSYCCFLWFISLSRKDWAQHSITDSISVRVIPKFSSYSSCLHCDSLPNAFRQPAFQIVRKLLGGGTRETLHSSKISESSKKWKYVGHRIIPGQI